MRWHLPHMYAEFSIWMSRWPTETSIFIYVRRCQKAADLFNSIFICYQFIFNIILWFGDWLFRANPNQENINYFSIYWISECVLSCWGDAVQSGHETTNNFILKYWECTTYFHFPFVGNVISLCRCVHIGFVLLSSEEFYSIFMFFLFLFLSITPNARKCCVHVIYAVSDDQRVEGGEGDDDDERKENIVQRITCCRVRSCPNRNRKSKCILVARSSQCHISTTSILFILMPNGIHDTNEFCVLFYCFRFAETMSLDQIWTPQQQLTHASHIRRHQYHCLRYCFRIRAEGFSKYVFYF